MKLLYSVILIFVLAGCAQHPVQNSNLNSQLIKKANLGDRSATHKLCASYHFAIDAEENSKLAFEWCKKSAKLGVNSGQTLLGEMYMAGKVTDMDYSKALYWYKEAAKRDHPHAMYMVYIMYNEGLGVERDEVIALDALEAAAILGSESAKKRIKIQQLKEKL
jgi:TPR repeat protein